MRANYPDTHSDHPPARPLTVMAADDHFIFLEGIASLLGAEADIRLVALARTGREALERYRALRPDVVLMDLRMPDMDGIEATQAIVREFPGARIVMLTTYESRGLLSRAFQAGAVAYVIKSSLQRDLGAVVRNACSERYCQALRAALSGPGAGNCLTARELEVLKLVAQGHSNRSTGLALSITEETVKGHMKSILPKLGAKDRAHAVAVAFDQGLLVAQSDGGNGR